MEKQYPDTPKMRKRFWNKVQETESCWIWNGARYPNDYGQFAIRTSHPVLAHRIVYEWTFGVIPQGHFVLHRCDNHRCVNPSHLFTGTHKTNMADMVAKGRSTLGERNPMAKLTEEQVRQIRTSEMTNTTHLELAERYSVSRALIQAVRKRQIWKHID